MISSILLVILVEYDNLHNLKCRLDCCLVITADVILSFLFVAHEAREVHGEDKNLNDLLKVVFFMQVSKVHYDAYS